MVQRKLTITNKLGLHARPSVTLVKKTGLFKSRITIQKDDIEVDGKSVLAILMLGAGAGTELLISCDGPDENEALEAVSLLIESGFSE
jgi:phosphocarrier protein